MLAALTQRVEELDPGLVVVDSFRGLARAAAGAGAGRLELADFTQRLAVRLAGAQATTFLVGEYGDAEARDDPAFTVADGILLLSKDVERNAVVRKLQVLKLRGQATRPGLHLFRIGAAGLRVFPRVQLPPEPTDRPLPATRLDAGVPGLDALTGGGILVGDAVLVSGPTGAGKSILALQFIVAGARAGEPGVIAIFDEHPGAYLRRAAGLGFDLPALQRAGRLRLLYLRALDLSPGEAFEAIREAAAGIGARRVVIDSLSGFELALAPSYRGEEYREALYRLVGALTGGGITALLTAESSGDAITDLRFSPFAISILADDIIALRYAEEAPGRLSKSLAVVKMRGSVHGKEFRPYDIVEGGIVVHTAPAAGPGGGADPGGPATSGRRRGRGGRGRGGRGERDAHRGGGPWH